MKDAQKLAVWIRGTDAVFIAAIGPRWRHAMVACVEPLASFVCHLVYLPQFIGDRIFIRREWIDEGAKQRFSLREWYGPYPLDGLHSTVLTWAHNQFRYREITVPMATVIAAWGDDAPQWWRDSLQSAEEYVAKTGKQ